jgi:hypothetical protein
MPRPIVLLPVLLVLLACNLTPSIPSEPAPTLPPLTPTVPPPVPNDTPAATLPVEPTPIPGWLTYHNEFVGYSFEYPPQAVLTTTGITGYPTDELPAGLSPDQYMATLEATYPDTLCVGAELPAAFFVIQAPEAKGGRYAGPCGISGVGAYDLRNEDLPVTIDGEAYILRVTRLFEVGTETLAGEFGGLSLGDGTRFNFGSTWGMNGLTYDDYLADRAFILQVISSYRGEP